VGPRTGLNVPVGNRTTISPCSNPWLSHGLEHGGSDPFLPAT